MMNEKLQLRLFLVFALAFISIEAYCVFIPPVNNSLYSEYPLGQGDGLYLTLFQMSEYKYPSNYPTMNLQVILLRGFEGNMLEINITQLNVNIMNIYLIAIAASSNNMYSIDNILYSQKLVNEKHLNISLPRQLSSGELISNELVYYLVFFSENMASTGQHARLPIYNPVANIIVNIISKVAI